MATLADSLVSSSARKLPIRRRPDLLARRQRYQGRSYWVVKDPVGLHYFRFQEEEYAILQMLDGETSLDEIKEQFEDEFPPQKITLEEIQQFLGMLHRSGLILAGVQGQGEQLLKRRRERRNKELLQTVSNILCIRFKGFDPERAFNWMYPKIRWLFKRAALVLSLLLIASAALLVASNFRTFQSKLPEFHQFFTPANAFWLAITLACTKVMHEFGHGLSCKHFGGECHELGVMVLVLTPCLYCNVSDSWMLPSKWHRAAIGAAGMYVELILASICTWLWWFSEPGLLNNLCLNVMFVSSVSTIVFNANPLLRYDGYYILSDLSEIPNLRQKATQILSRKLGAWCLGLEEPDDPFLPERNQIFFALYSIAAAAYRWVVTFSILWFLYRIFKPYRLEVLGWMMGMASLYGLLVMPLYQVGKFFYVPGRMDKVKKPRMYLSLAVLGLVIAGVVLIPLPYSVLATLELQARDAHSVFVDVRGRLAEVHVQPGDRVTKGQVLARLESPDLELRIAQTTGQRDALQSQCDSLRHRQYEDPVAAVSLPEIEESLRAKNKQLEELREDYQQLTLRAPCDGVVLSPPTTHRKHSPDGPLPSWDGTPLECKNLEAWLEEGSLFCQIGDPVAMEAILLLDQADVPFVRKDQRAEIKLDELPHETLEGTVTEDPSQENLKVVSRRLTAKAGGEQATKTDPNTGIESPLNASYQTRVPLDNPDGLLLLGLRGRAKVHMEFDQWQTIGQRAWRLVTRTFNFKL